MSKRRRNGKKKILENAKSESNREYEDYVNNRVLAKGTIPLIILTIFIILTRAIHADVFKLDIVTGSEALILLLGYVSYTQFLILSVK